MDEHFMVGDLVYLRDDETRMIYEVIGAYETEKFEYGDYIYQKEYDLLSSDLQTTLEKVPHENLEEAGLDAYTGEDIDEIINQFIDTMENGMNLTSMALDNVYLDENFNVVEYKSSSLNKSEIVSVESDSKLIYSKHLDVTLTENDTLDNLLDDYNITKSKMSLTGYSPKDLEIFETQLKIIRDKLSLLSGKDGSVNE